MHGKFKVRPFAMLVYKLSIYIYFRRRLIRTPLFIFSIYNRNKNWNRKPQTKDQSL